MIEQHVAQIWKHLYLAIVLLGYYMATPPPHAPNLVVTDMKGRVHYEQSYIYDHRMPQTISQHVHGLSHDLSQPIPHRYDPSHTSDPKAIDQQLHSIRTCIHDGRYADIDSIAYCIKDNNFDYPSGTGMLIMRLRDHPFVVKLFMTTYDTLTQPHGFEPYFFMRMNGGINRHIAGLTRITTNRALRHFLDTHKDSYSHVTTPRAWSWTPADTSWLNVQLHDQNTRHVAEIPAEYALINDAIEYTSDHFAPQETVFQLFQDTDNLFDPHNGNCVIDKHTGEYVILDTEAFLIMTGFHRPIYTTSYIRWYLNLIYTCAKYLLFPQITRRNMTSTYAQHAQAYTPHQHHACAYAQSSHMHT